jgi:hypothetical protein
LDEIHPSRDKSSFPPVTGKSNSLLQTVQWARSVCPVMGFVANIAEYACAQTERNPPFGATSENQLQQADNRPAEHEPGGVQLVAQQQD